MTLPTQDTEEMCRQVLRFAHMPQEEYQQICKNARRAAQDYDYRALTQRLLQILEDTVK